MDIKCTKHVGAVTLNSDEGLGTKHSDQTEEEGEGETADPTEVTKQETRQDEDVNAALSFNVHQIKCPPQEM